MDRVARLLGRQAAHLELGRGRPARPDGRPRRACPPPRESRPGCADRRRSGTGSRSSTRRSSTSSGAAIRLEQRHRGQGLPGLAVAALHDVAAVPRVADRVDDRTGGSLDRRDGLADRTFGRRSGRTSCCARRSGRCRPRRSRRRTRTSCHAGRGRPASTHSSGVFACRSSTSTSAPLTTRFIWDLRLGCSIAAGIRRTSRSSRPRPSICAMTPNTAAWSSSKPVSTVSLPFSSDFIVGKANRTVAPSRPLTRIVYKSGGVAT